MSSPVPLPGNDPEPRPEPASFVAERSLKRELLEELRAGWQAQAPVAPEDLLARWPTDTGSDPDVASVLFEDFLQRQQQGQDVSVKEYESRFPAQRDSLANLFRHHAVLRSVGGSTTSSPRLSLPDVGDEVFGFRLQRELGRGAFARVFLAGQADLAGRAVVVKVSGIDGDEPQVLAQLQHTHIVPIYSVHEDPRAGLRAVCMPYFGGASLSQVLRACWADDPLPRTGRQLVQALQTVSAPWPAPGAEGMRDEGRGMKKDGSSSFIPHPSSLIPSAPALARLGGSTYVQAAAWLVARLAEALHHAHQRGIQHRDIKPSNILLGAEGEPMLLDFNLAQSCADGQAQAHATLGGTIAYMAPEHLRAVAARTPDLSRQVDQRADIYSLGMVLYEVLAGRTPFDQSGSYLLLPPQLEAMALERGKNIPSLRKARPDVPWGLESIARKCLAPDPARRYQSAGQLAEDLQAFLHDQPLRHAPELSYLERLRKWERRHPQLTSSGSVAVLAAALLFGAGAALVGIHNHLSEARQNLAVADARECKQRFEDSTQDALCRVNLVSKAADHWQHGRAACERALSLYHVLEREDWQEAPAWRLLGDDERLALAEDVRELLLLLAAARSELSPDAATVREALGLLARAEAIEGLGPSRALWDARAEYHQRLGEQEAARAARSQAARLAPVSARDHHLLAYNLVLTKRPGEARTDHAQAIRELTTAIEKNPRHYWSHVQRGICYEDLGEHLLAAADFATCTGLRPDSPFGYFNQGYALYQAGHKAEAIRAFSAALKHDANFAPAYLNRGLAQLECKRYAEALADYERAAELGHDDAPLHLGRGVALEGLGRAEEADEAFAVALRRSPGAADKEGQRLRWVYGFAVARRLPERAAAAFDEVLRHEPNQPQALYGRAMLLVDRFQRLDEAIGLFGRALEAQPGFTEARRARAVLLARRGRFQEAQDEMNQCLERDPRGGATLYAAACVAARVAEKHQGPVRDGAEAQALACLKQALEAGYGHDQAADDPDLAALRAHPEFGRLLSPSPPTPRPRGARGDESNKT